MDMASGIESVATEDAPRPAGHYSQGSAWRDLVFVSGQLGQRPDGSHTFEAPFDEQAAQALDNVLAILKAADVGLEGIVRMTAYIAGVENWPAFNRIYAEKLGSSKPARTVVPVSELHHGYLVEVEAIGVRGIDRMVGAG
ncbi:RidA family protein [Sphingobium sp. HWE2-09]|uniref:RidA family protein n=1 Tax=Sphingobium sp. HWE2-09 TaxID=3108390 RepID=UPI002DD22BBC|nr:RidA family protein [Sphingobium sp. HWE2-09]